MMIRTLENEFFPKEDQRLTARLRELQDKAASREALGEGLRDQERGHPRQAVPARHAWADGSIDERERRQILERAEKSDIAPSSTDHSLLQSWLERRPDPKLLSAWIHMVEGLCEHMTPEQVRALRSDLIERARAIASASGGLLGVGKVSAAEADMIHQLESAFGGK